MTFFVLCTMMTWMEDLIMTSTPPRCGSICSGSMATPCPQVRNLRLLDLVGAYDHELAKYHSGDYLSFIKVYHYKKPVNL